MLNTSFFTIPDLFWKQQIDAQNVQPTESHVILR